MVKALSHAVMRVADFLWPPQCLACRCPVSEPHGLCADCWRDVTFITPPLCRACGLPFDYDPGDMLCAACLARPPAYHAARAVMRYDDVARKLILSLKHGDRQEGVPAFGRWLARAAGDVPAAGAVIVPVPLHRRRLFRRRFNQAALLALSLARVTGAVSIPDALVRHRATPSQGGLGRRGRFRNVRGAFALNPARRKRLAGRRVILVDDVLTTGATAEACARVLHHADATDISILTLARVVQPRTEAI